MSVSKPSTVEEQQVLDQNLSQEKACITQLANHWLQEGFIKCYTIPEDKFSFWDVAVKLSNNQIAFCEVKIRSDRFKNEDFYYLFQDKLVRIRREAGKLDRLYNKESKRYYINITAETTFVWDLDLIEIDWKVKEFQESNYRPDVRVRKTYTELSKAKAHQTIRLPMW